METGLREHEMLNLREQIEDLEQDRADLIARLRALANGGIIERSEGEYCAYCKWAPHQDDCPITVARALLDRLDG